MAEDSRKVLVPDESRWMSLSKRFKSVKGQVRRHLQTKRQASHNAKIAQRFGHRYRQQDRREHHAETKRKSRSWCKHQVAVHQSP